MDRDFAFTLVHLPIPHAPHAYNRKTGTFTLGNSPIAGYIDSLALLDRTVGEFRRTMEEAGVWDSTTVLFTSDHGYRDSEPLDGKSDPRVPYILKLASQKDAVAVHAGVQYGADGGPLDGRAEWRDHRPCSGRCVAGSQPDAPASSRQRGRPRERASLSGWDGSVACYREG